MRMRFIKGAERKTGEEVYGEEEKGFEVSRAREGDAKDGARRRHVIG